MRYCKCSTASLSRLALSVALAFLALSFSQLSLETRASLVFIERSLPKVASDPGNPGAQRILFRTGGLVNEGLGSFLQHIKESVIFSICVDAELMLPEAESRSHHYSNSALYNKRVDWTQLRFVPPVCDIAPIMEALGGFRGLISTCFGNGTKVLNPMAVANMTKDCGSFVHYVETRELHQEYNEYVEDWVKRRLPEPSGVWREGVLRVGIHIRWGDTANRGGVGVPDLTRSITFENVTRIMTFITDCTARVHFKIFAERMEENFIRDRVPGEYELVNDGHAWDNLVDLASADVIVSGVSTYGVMALLMSEAKLSIVTEPKHQKFMGLNRTDKMLVGVEDLGSVRGLCPWLRHSLAVPL